MQICHFYVFNCIGNRVCKIIENVTLVLALKFEDFQGKSSKHPWNFNCFKPWIDLVFPWKPYPRPHLEFQGFSRVTLEKPWAQNIAFFLTLNFKDFRGFSRITLKNLEQKVFISIYEFAVFWSFERVYSATRRQKWNQIPWEYWIFSEL